MKYFIKSAIYFFGIIAISFILWNIGWGFYAGIVLLISFSIGCLLFYKKKEIKYFAYPILIGLVLYVGMLPFTLYQYNRTSAEYMQRVERGMDLNFIEKMNVYGLNIIISLGAYPFYPEVAKESFLLIFPTKNNERTFESCFFMKSEKIKMAFQNKKNFVTWSEADYLRFNHESRAALALNPCKLEKVKNGNSIVYKAKVKVSYPYKSHTQVLPGIFIDEGLFHYLQKVGWLHPYTAVWICEKSEL
jgi:hypothetical protein